MKLSKIERGSLAYFAAGSREKPRPRPKGLGGVGLMNFFRHKWIERFGRDGDTGEQLYRITPSGIVAHELNPP